MTHCERARIDPALAAGQQNGNEMSDSKVFFWGEDSALAIEWINDWQDNYEIEPSSLPGLSGFLCVYVGTDFDEEEHPGVTGIGYLLSAYSIPRNTTLSH